MIESRWGHAKKAVYRGGQTRSGHIQLKLDEFCVRRSFFKKKPYLFHKMGRILAQYGVAARRYAAM